MKQIFHSVIKRKVIYLVYFLGNGLNELILDINLEEEKFNSIEVYKNILLLHRFDDSLEYTIDFDDLDLDYKIEIYKTLFCFL